MADALLEKMFNQSPIDWEGVCDLLADNERRQQYLNALRAADAEDYQLLFDFAGYSQIS